MPEATPMYFYAPLLTRIAVAVRISISALPARYVENRRENLPKSETAYIAANGTRIHFQNAWEMKLINTAA